MIRTILIGLMIALVALLVVGCGESAAKTAAKDTAPSDTKEADAAPQKDAVVKDIKTDTTTDAPVKDPAKTDEAKAPATTAAAEKTLTMTGENFKFMMDGVKNPDITVAKGTKVTIKFTSTEGFHDWRLDEYVVGTDKVNADASSSVTFVADKAGEFEYFCSVGSHRAQGMKGKFVVK